MNNPMKKAALALMCTLTLASCGTPQENLKEMQDMKPLCEAQGKEVQFDDIGV
jgi:hypothetical protein